MGIRGFFTWLKTKKYHSEIVRNYLENEPNTEDKTSSNPNEDVFDNLYLDMNGLIHSPASKDYHSKSKSEDDVIRSTLNTIDRIVAIVRPRRLLYIAIDGVAPRAKLNYQRSKRALRSYTKEEIEKKRTKILSEGRYLPDAPDEKANKSFHEICIKPGTAFMLRLSECLRYYIYERMNRESNWQSIKVILSDANVPGEGEHKIMDFIRQQKKSPAYDRATSHVLFGADVDLVLLGVALDEQQITIIRDEQKTFCVLCYQWGHSFETCTGSLTSQSKNFEQDSNETNYKIVDLSKLCEKLFYEQMEKSNFEWDRKRFLDDWVFICLLMGNDFLPCIPLFKIDENGIDILLEIYSCHVPRLNQYLTDNGKLQINVFKSIAKELEEKEDQKANSKFEFIRQLLADSRISRPRTTSSVNIAEISAQKQTTISSLRPPPYSRATNAATGKSTETASSLQKISVSDSLSSTASNVQHNDQTKSALSDLAISNLSKENWRELYYQRKFSPDESRQKVVQEYIRGLQWVLQYYYHGVPSWDWYYPHHRAPLASDFTKYRDEPVQFNQESQPLKPLEQLILRLPPQYRTYLPRNWQQLPDERDLPIIHLHSSGYDMHTNEKQYISQYTAIVPFVEDEDLDKICNYQYPPLTDEENERNEIRNDVLFIHHHNEHFSAFKEALNAYITPERTVENPIESATNIDLSGCIWRDDRAINIGKRAQALLSGYCDISNNQVLSGKYKC